MNYDPLSHSRHNAGDRRMKVGHEIKDSSAQQGAAETVPD